MTIKYFGKAGWLFFAKAKEKQAIANGIAILLHICFCPTLNKQ
jgi:hypothetical protein